MSVHDDGDDETRQNFETEHVQFFAVLSCFVLGDVLKSWSPCHHCRTEWGQLNVFSNSTDFESLLFLCAQDYKCLCAAVTI